MSLKQISTSPSAMVVVVLATAVISFPAVAANQPGNPYWQAPNWSGYNAQPQQHRANPYQPQPRPATPYNGQQNMNRGNIPPPPAGPYASQYSQQPKQQYNSQQYNQQQGKNTQQYGRPPNPPVNQYGGGRSAPYKGYYGQRPSNAPYYGPNHGASAYNMPGYNQNRPYSNNQGWGNDRWNSSRFWGGSGPSKWMSPSKDNWENSWDDMINSPSRMGEMPGGWTAPEVTMPNPIDMGDQMQDNVQDLPEQMKNIDVGS